MLWFCSNCNREGVEQELFPPSPSSLLLTFVEWIELLSLTSELAWFRFPRFESLLDRDEHSFPAASLLTVSTEFVPMPERRPVSVVASAPAFLLLDAVGVCLVLLSLILYHSFLLLLLLLLMLGWSMKLLFFVEWYWYWFTGLHHFLKNFLLGTCIMYAFIEISKTLWIMEVLRLAGTTIPAWQHRFPSAQRS